MQNRDDPDAMVVVAILTSRVEALVLAGVLEAAGVIVTAGGIHHASVQVNSIALGGHRLWVPRCQWAEASGVIREVGAHRNWQFSKGLRSAIVRLLVVYLGLKGAILLLATLVGGSSWLALLLSPLEALTVPVNPQGRGDYFLVAET